MTRYAALERQGIPYRLNDSRPEIAERLATVRDAATALHARAKENGGLVALASEARLATVVGSAQLEGNPLDLTDARAVLAGEPLPEPFEVQEEHRREIVNLACALDYADGRVGARRPAGLADLYAIQERVMTGLLPREALGRARSIPMATYFIETGEKIGDCPDPEELSELLAELEDWLRSTASSGDPWLRATGFQFLAREVHPFVGGNRRTARVFQRLLLRESGAEAIGALSSWEWAVACDSEQRAALPRAVAEARATGCLDPFLLFNLRAFELGLERAAAALVTPAIERLAEASEGRARAEDEARRRRSRIGDSAPSSSKGGKRRPKRRPESGQKDLD